MIKEYYVICDKKVLGVFYSYQLAEEYLFYYIKFNPNSHPEIVVDYLYYIFED